MMDFSHFQVIQTYGISNCENNYIWYKQTHIHTIFHINNDSFPFFKPQIHFCVIKNDQFHTHKSYQLLYIIFTNLQYIPY